MPLPLEIIGLNRPELTLVWDDEHKSIYPARYLRLHCSCAHCIDEMTGKPLLNPQGVPMDITISKVDLMGTYGIAIQFSDSHGTGIYRFKELLDECSCPECSKKPKSA